MRERKSAGAGQVNRKEKKEFKKKFKKMKVKVCSPAI